jgi:hypothetical protein
MRFRPTIRKDQQTRLRSSILRLKGNWAMKGGEVIGYLAQLKKRPSNKNELATKINLCKQAHAKYLSVVFTFYKGKGKISSNKKYRKK